MGGELRHRAIRDSAKVTQELSGGAGIQHSLSVTSLGKGCGQVPELGSCKQGRAAAPWLGSVG